MIFIITKQFLDKFVKMLLVKLISFHQTWMDIIFHYLLVKENRLMFQIGMCIHKNL